VLDFIPILLRSRELAGRKQETGSMFYAPRVFRISKDETFTAFRRTAIFLDPP